MRLTKHHGLGNDFLVVLDTDGSHPLNAGLARALCHRHTGIGADGIIRAAPAGDGSGALVRMDLLNADGSRAEMSGNGIRCLGQALILGWPGLGDALPADLPVATDCGLRTVTVHRRDDAVTHHLSVAMGPARLDGEAPEWTGGPIARALLVDMGNPHLVLDVTGGDGDEIDLIALGEAVNAKVPGGANVHLLAAGDPGIAIRTYERGVGPTLACGTGACASAAAARAWGLAGDRVAVDQPGGRADVTLGAPGGDVVLGGPATFVATVEPGVSPWR
ncbi:MAG TPA: diaminopimelate epimerase [Acidimicrobiales bacterium]|nr:diaminopimelate epimerase [Acidimicrobiales bacterium]